MLRLTLLLCAAMVGALLILGEDRGQLRPGLANAVATQTNPVPPLAAEPAPMLTGTVPDSAPVQPAVARLASDTAPPIAAQPELYVEPSRQAVEEAIFTLSALGNELVPGEGETATDASESTATSQAGGGTIWYVNANSVNVRAEPSTGAEVLGRLVSGEAALLVAEVNGGWARIVIQGDGVEGYVARRYLSPEAP